MYQNIKVCDACPSKDWYECTQSPNKSTEAPARKPCYDCAVCNKPFSFKYQLMRHQRSHTGERPFECKHCGKCFNYNSALLEHLRVHSGEKPYQCTVCNRYFRQKSTLNRHKRTHTGEKPYKCDFCNKSFTQRSSLSWHIISHNGQTPFYCPKCNMYFTRKGAIIKHYKTFTHAHVNKELYRCGDISTENHLQSHQCLVNGSTLQNGRPLEVTVKVEKPDELETSLELLVRTSDLLNDLKEENEET